MESFGIVERFAFTLKAWCPHCIGFVAEGCGSSMFGLPSWGEDRLVWC